MKNNLLMGWAEVSITPEKRIRLDGQFYERISEYVETPITVTALAMKTEGEITVICSADLTHIDPRLMREVRERISAELPAVDPKNVIISATHTHTSFVYEGEQGSGLNALAKLMKKYSIEGDEATPEELLPADVMRNGEATAFLVDRVFTAVKESVENLAPAVYANGFGRAAVGMCRRVCYKDGTAQMWGDTYNDEFFALEGGNDNGIELLFTYTEDKKLTGIVANIACPSQILEQRSFISSDYWGKLKKYLRRELGEDIKVLALCSPAGDQCPRDLVRWIEPETPIKDPNVIRTNPPVRRADPSMYDIKGCERVGRRIASEILAVLEEVNEYKTEATLEHKSFVDYKLPLRTVTKEENDAAIAALDAFADAAKNSGVKIGFKENASMHVHAGIVARYERQQTESEVPAEMHIIRFGDIAFATCPFELFLDFANIIRARSAALQTFLIQLACDAKGYLPTEKAELGGHYSAYVSSGHVGHEGGYILVEDTLKEIDKLFN